MTVAEQLTCQKRAAGGAEGSIALAETLTARSVVCCRDFPATWGNTPRAEIRLGEDARTGETRFRHGRPHLGLEAPGGRFAVDRRDIRPLDPPFQTERAYWRMEWSGLPRLPSSLGLNEGIIANYFLR